MSESSKFDMDFLCLEPAPFDPVPDAAGVPVHDRFREEEVGLLLCRDRMGEDDERAEYLEAYIEEIRRSDYGGHKVDVKKLRWSREAFKQATGWASNVLDWPSNSLMALAYMNSVLEKSPSVISG
jgi:hypothetical protein